MYLNTFYLPIFETFTAGSWSDWSDWSGVGDVDQSGDILPWRSEATGHVASWPLKFWWVKVAGKMVEESNLGILEIELGFPYHVLGYLGGFSISMSIYLVFAEHVVEVQSGKVNPTLVLEPAKCSQQNLNKNRRSLIWHDMESDIWLQTLLRYFWDNLASWTKHMCRS